MVHMIAHAHLKLKLSACLFQHGFKNVCAERSHGHAEEPERRTQNHEPSIQNRSTSGTIPLRYPQAFSSVPDPSAYLFGCGVMRK